MKKQDRADMYRFLGRLYLLEVDADTFRSLKKLRFPGNMPEGPYAEGCAEMQSCLEALNEGDLEELAADYARVFLAAGIALGGAAFPFASVYTSKRRLIMQETAESDVDLYAKAGLYVSDEIYRAAEDHIGLELTYMSYLLERGEEGRAEAYLENHLLGWVPAFCRETQKYAETGFYKALAMLTDGFLMLEQEAYSEKC